VKKILAVILVLIVFPACAMKQKKVEKSLEGAGPPNCATAEGDLRVLESEKANVAERMAAGVTAIAPAGIVMGILTGTEGTKIRVAAGKYNDAIERRISEIKETCGVE
jgi:hypothetical protein